MLLAPPSPLILPDEPGYDAARTAWNLSADQRPAAVAHPTTVAGIVHAVREARERGFAVTAQGTGHGALSLDRLDDVVLINTNRCRGVEIDTYNRVARVEPGAQWQDVVGPAARHGFAVLHGSSPDVGVVGYTLGGGVSFYGRRYGTSASRMIGAEVVTSDGRVLRADRRTNPDLFAALQGGGGSFAIVLSMELELIEPGPVQAGHLWFPLERGAEVFKAWARWAPSLPEHAMSVARVVRIPDIDGPPEHLRGKEFSMIQTIVQGTPGEADALLAPVRALGAVMDTTGPMPYEGLPHLHMDPPGPVPGRGDHFSMDVVTDASIDALFGAMGPSLLGVQIIACGGRLAPAIPPYLVFGVGMTPTAEATDVVLDELKTLRAAMAPFAGERLYANFVEETGEAPANLWDAETLTRLRAAKVAYDPTNAVRSNHPVV